MAAFTQRLKEALETLAGLRGPRDNHAVLHKELSPYLRALSDAGNRLTLLTGGIRTVSDRADEAFDIANGVINDTEQRINEFREDVISAYGPINTDNPLIDQIELQIDQLTTARDRIDTLYEQLIDLSQLNFGLGQRIRDAGIYVDPDTGSVRIYGVDAAEARVGQVEIRTSAVEAAISLTATVGYVNDAISNALFDPTQIPVIDDIQATLSTVQINLNAEIGRIDTLASLLQVDGQNVSMTDVSQTLDTLTEQAATFVTSATFTPALTRIEGVEQTLGTLGDVAAITDTVTASRLVPEALTDLTERTLADLWDSYRERASIRSSTAAGQERLEAYITDENIARAAATLNLQAQVDANKALVLQEQAVRADADSVNALSVTQLQGRVDSVEIGLGTVNEDITTVQGGIEDILGLNVNADSAFGLWLTEIIVQFGDTQAFTQQAATAYAGFDSLSSTYVLRQVAGGAEGSVEAVAVDNPFGDPLSTFRISYDNIDLNGSVSARDLTITAFNGNIIPNGNLRFGDFRAWESVSTNFSLMERTPGGDTIQRTAPTAYFLVMPYSAQTRSAVLETFQVSGGEDYSLSYYVNRSAGAGGTVRLRIDFTDINGAALTPIVLGRTLNMGAWVEVQGAYTAPVGAVTGVIKIERVGGGAGTAYVTQLRVFQRDPAATRLTPNSITSELISVNSLSAVSANIGTFSSAATGERVVISDDRITVYDADNNIRVRIGNLS